jgi:hypothetical protein
MYGENNIYFISYNQVFFQNFDDFFQKFSIFLGNLNYIKNNFSILFVVTVQKFAPPPPPKEKTLVINMCSMA